MPYYLSPVANDSQTSTSGAPLSGGFVYTYAVGTTTPQATYTDSTGGTPQANPVVLNTYGLPPSPIWLTGGQAYKFQIKDSLGNLIRTIDTVYGINDPTGTALTNNFSGSLTASVSGSALTIALKTASGADPSAAEPVYVGFRSATAGTGTVAVRSVTSALSITIPSAATMGQANAVAARLWVGMIDNAGTVELAAVNTQLGGGQISPVSEAILASTTALSAAADSAGVWYSTTARTNVAMRLLGFIENTQATAGTWATAPSVIQTMGPGVHKPGDVVQLVRTSNGIAGSGTTIIPADNTIPQNTEGDQYITQAITPTSEVNTLIVESNLCLTGPASNLSAALFQDSTANALAAAMVFQGAASGDVVIPVSYAMRAGTASSTTFKIRAGSSIAGTTSVNTRFGGVSNSYITVTELMA